MHASYFSLEDKDQYPIIRKGHLINRQLSSQSLSSSVLFKTILYMLLRLLLLFVVIPTISLAQTETVGLLYQSGQETEGYTLFAPEQSSETYLINNCGNVMNQWTFSELPGATCYLLENGNLLRAGKDSLEIRDWDNTLVWSYAMNENGLLQHHDIEPLPNGNILCLLSETFTNQEIIDLGRDPAYMTEDNFSN